VGQDGKGVGGDGKVLADFAIELDSFANYFPSLASQLEEFARYFRDLAYHF